MSNPTPEYWDARGQLSAHNFMLKLARGEDAVPELMKMSEMFNKANIARYKLSVEEDDESVV